MAEILLAHEDDHVVSGYWYCTCGHEYGVFGGFGEAKAEHLAAKLIEAGYGPIPAPVLEEAEPDLGPCPYPGVCPSVCWGCG